MKARNLIDLEDISLEDIDEIIHLAGMIKGKSVDFYRCLPRQNNGDAFL